MRSGVKYIDANGDPEAEAALGEMRTSARTTGRAQPPAHSTRALVTTACAVRTVRPSDSAPRTLAAGAALAALPQPERDAVVVGTTVTASSPGLLRERVEAAAARLGVPRIPVLCLEWEWDSGDVADNGSGCPQNARTAHPTAPAPNDRG